MRCRGLATSENRLHLMAAVGAILDSKFVLVLDWMASAVVVNVFPLEEGVRGKRGSPEGSCSQPSGCLLDFLLQIARPLTQERPDKPAEFPRDGNQRFVALQMAGYQAHETLVKSVLRFPA